MARKKIALIGGGQIGGVLAQLCALPMSCSWSISALQIVTPSKVTGWDTCSYHICIHFACSTRSWMTRPL